MTNRRDKQIFRGKVLIAEQTRQMVMENGAMWRPRGNGLKIDSFQGQEKVQTSLRLVRLEINGNSGEINLRPESGELGSGVVKGNVYFGDQPVCDDGWGGEEAKVACR